jgi:S-DNA-T family DNA segregation ATPase FtsK/SpoIIIE
MARKKIDKKVEKAPMFDDLTPQARQAIGAVVMGVLGVFFLFALFESGGPMGSYIQIALQFLFGSGAWLAPFACFLYIYVLLNPRENEKVSAAKVIGTILLFVAALGSLELYKDELGGVIGLVFAWPMEYLLGAALTGILFFGTLLISIFLIFNTGMKLPSFALLKNLGTSDDEMEPDEEELEDFDEIVEEPLGEDETDEEEKTSLSMAALVSNITKSKPNDILVKNFSGTYIPPSLSLLSKEISKANIGDVKANANTIKRTLKEFGISVEMDAVESGPTITRYALKPAQGVRISRIAGLQQELQLALKASSIRVEAPIPGKSLVGIEVPNQTRATVGLASLLSTPEYTDSPHPLIVALGKDVTGNVHFANVARMPHGLIAGTTGSILVDPKRVELTLYNKIPHLLTPVITDAKKAIRALAWAVKEMERRYDILEAEQVQNIASYHKNIYQVAKKEWEKKGKDPEEQINLPEALPYIVIVLDELNDLMQAFPRELEAMIVRLAQMSRAVGIHLILATQRPSVNVITGTIKANVPTRIALAVASQIDSRTIIDSQGAEKLLGAGDMLYLSSDSPRPYRLQSAFISEEEIKRVVEYLRKQSTELDTINFDENADSSGGDSFFKSLTGSDDADDDLYEDAKQAVMEAGKASTSYLQRKLRVGYSRAARLIDLLEENGVIGKQDGSRPREILDGSAGSGEDSERV